MAGRVEAFILQENPAAMLTAIVVPAVVLHGGGGGPAPARGKLIAALLASVVAWRTRSPAATMVAAMAALWLTQWLLRFAAA